MNQQYITQPISAKLSASLLRACQEAGIPEPEMVFQGTYGTVFAKSDGVYTQIDHPPFSHNCQANSLVFVKHPTLADVKAAHTIDEYAQ
jgi:hypothetical protein